MMTAMSAMAEYPNALQNLFVTKEFTERGKYTIRLCVVSRSPSQPRPFLFSNNPTLLKQLQLEI